jgi:phosphate transport system substrate-binding protein
MGFIYAALIGSMQHSVLSLLSFLFLFIPLFFLGRFWAKKFIKEVNFTANFALFAPLIYTLFCLNLAFVLSGWSYANEHFLRIALISNPLFIVPNFLLIFTGKPMYAFLLQIISYGMFGAGFALALRKKGLLKFSKNIKILTFISLILSLLCISQWFFRNSHFLPYSVAKIESIDDSGSFEPSITALRNEPSLKFEDDFPNLDGATALCPIFFSAYKAIYPKTEYDFKYATCSSTPYAYGGLINGEVDLIFALSPSDEQLQRAAENGVELILTPIGKEAFVFMTNMENPVKNLSVEQIRQIYTGKITNWRELGGEDEKILAFQRIKNSGSQTAMEKYVMKGLTFKAPIKEEFRTMNGMMEGVADYRNAKNAIGYSFRYYATVMNGSENIKLLNINGISPNIENIKNNTYPFAAEFYIVSTQNSSENSKKLIEWFLSEEGQMLIKDVGYVPLKEF